MSSCVQHIIIPTTATTYDVKNTTDYCITMTHELMCTTYHHVLSKNDDDDKKTNHTSLKNRITLAEYNTLRSPVNHLITMYICERIQPNKYWSHSLYNSTTIRKFYTLSKRNVLPWTSLSARTAFGRPRYLTHYKDVSFVLDN